MSSRAYLVDLIHSIGEKTALVDHLEEKLLFDEDNENLKQLIKNSLQLRREQMNLLLENAQQPNPLFWCDFKHAVKSWTNDVEVYEATLTEESFARLKESTAILAGVTSLFLGMEFETCSRCLFDKMLVIETENKGEKNV